MHSPRVLAPILVETAVGDLDQEAAIRGRRVTCRIVLERLANHRHVGFGLAPGPNHNRVLPRNIPAGRDDSFEGLGNLRGPDPMRQIVGHLRYNHRIPQKLSTTQSSSADRPVCESFDRKRGL